MTEDPILIEATEPTLWNAGVAARIQPNGDVVITASEPDPMPLTPCDLTPSYST